MDTLFRKRGSASKSHISLNDDVFEEQASPTESLRAVAYADAPLGQIPNSGPSKGPGYGPSTPNPRQRSGQSIGSISSLDKQRISAPSTNQSLSHDPTGSGMAEIIMTDEPAGLDSGGHVIGGKMPRTQTMSTMGSTASGSVRRQTSVASRLEVLPESGNMHLMPSPGHRTGTNTPQASTTQLPPIARRGSSGSLQSLDVSRQPGFSMGHRYPVYSPNAVAGAMSSSTSIPATYRSEGTGRSDRFLIDYNDTSDSNSIRSARSGQAYQIRRAGPDSDKFWVTQPPDEAIEEAFKRLMDQRMDDTRQVNKSGGLTSPRKEGHMSLSSSRGGTPNVPGTPQSQTDEYSFSPSAVPQPQDRPNIGNVLVANLPQMAARRSRPSTGMGSRTEAVPPGAGKATSVDRSSQGEQYEEDLQQGDGQVGRCSRWGRRGEEGFLAGQGDGQQVAGYSRGIHQAAEHHDVRCSRVSKAVSVFEERGERVSAAFAVLIRS
jgi:hypothetical protein